MRSRSSSAIRSNFCVRVSVAEDRERERVTDSVSLTAAYSLVSDLEVMLLVIKDIFAKIRLERFVKRGDNKPSLGLKLLLILHHCFLENKIKN